MLPRIKQRACALWFFHSTTAISSPRQVHSHTSTHYGHITSVYTATSAAILLLMVSLILSLFAFTHLTRFAYASALLVRESMESSPVA